MRYLLACGAMVLGLALVPHGAGAVVVGQSDTFGDGTTQGWFAGGLGLGQVPPVPPQVVASGGPGGAGDAFLKLTSQGGDGPGSRLVAMNLSQWGGNYAAAGIGAIAMDLINLGQSDLDIRLLLEDPMGGPPANEAVTDFGAALPAGGAWTHVVIPVSAGALTALEGDAGTLLGQVTLLRIIHSTAADDADPIAGVLGVDNITALASVPEPAALGVLAPALLALSGLRRRRAPR